MKRDDNKRVKKVTGGAGRELPAAPNLPSGPEEAMKEGKGQAVVVAGGGLARGAIGTS